MAVLSSDRGLCGAFNNNLFRSRSRLGSTHSDGDGKDVRIFVYGRRASDTSASAATTSKSSTDHRGRPRDLPAEADKLADKLMDDVAANGTDEAYIAYNDYRS